MKWRLKWTRQLLNIVLLDIIIGIGRIGTYYVISFEYRRYSFVNGKRRPDSEPMSNTIVFANESIMAESFIYTNGANDILYY